MSAGGGAAGQFWGEFRALYEAAGAPTLASLVRLGEQKVPPAVVSDAALSEWLTGKRVPSRRNLRVFLALVTVLQVRAKARNAYEPQPEAWWQGLLAQAQDERSGTQKAGRPHEPGPRRLDGVHVGSGHAFISYVREDSSEVDVLQRMLEAAGIRVWRDTGSLWPGEDWRAKIRGAITRDALVFIACFSSHSAARQESYMNEALLLAIDQLRRRRPDDPWLIPVRFDDCDPPDFELGAGRTLASIQRADLFGAGRDLAARRLVEAVQRLLQQPGHPVAESFRSAGRTGSALSCVYVERRYVNSPDPSKWDVFISYASDDREEVARPLYQELARLGLRVWYDNSALRIGDSLRRKIDEGLANSAFCVVVASPAYIKKAWPQYEFDSVIARTLVGKQRVLPVWHQITADQVYSHSPMLADKVARNTHDHQIMDIAHEISQLILQPET